MSPGIPPTYNQWKIDPLKSKISFKVVNLFSPVIEGVFNVFDATIYTYGDDLTSAEADLWIDVSSVSTGQADLDERLKGADYFDLEHHSRIVFTSLALDKNDDEGNHRLSGQLTMKGVTKYILLKMQMDADATKASLTVTGKLNRSDWGVEASGFAEATVSDEVVVSCDLELVQVNQAEIQAKVTSDRVNKMGLKLEFSSGFL